MEGKICVGAAHNGKLAQKKVKEIVRLYFTVSSIIFPSLVYWVGAHHLRQGTFVVYSATSLLLQPFFLLNNRNSVQGIPDISLCMGIRHKSERAISI